MQTINALITLGTAALNLGIAVTGVIAARRARRRRRTTPEDHD